VSESVAQLGQIERAATHFQVSRREDADVQWFPTIYEHPLTEIKLFIIQTERPFNVLLDYFLLRCLFGTTSLHNLIHLARAVNA
jgi:hypothetical protein